MNDSTDLIFIKGTTGSSLKELLIWGPKTVFEALESGKLLRQRVACCFLGAAWILQRRPKDRCAPCSRQTAAVCASTEGLSRTQNVNQKCMDGLEPGVHTNGHSQIVIVKMSLCH
jgi:hypothetical protein